VNEGFPADVLTKFLAAVAGVASGLSLPSTLRHVIDAATTLAGAATAPSG